MIISDKEAAARLNSPINLLNKLRSGSLGHINGNDKRKNAMSLFIRPDITKPEIKHTSFSNPFKKEEESTPAPRQETNLAPLQSSAIQPSTNPQPSVDSILDNADSQIMLATAHDKAIGLLNKSIDRLSTELENVKADKLPSVISATSKVVEGIRKERNEAAKLGKDREVHYHFYTPQTKKVDDYKIIDVAAGPAPATP